MAKTTIITWANPASITVGTRLGATQLNAAATAAGPGDGESVPGTFAYSPPAGTVLNAGVDQTLSLTFKPTNAADFTGIPAPSPSVSRNRPKNASPSSLV